MYRCRLLLSISVVAMLLMPANALAVPPGVAVVDNFESYSTGLVNTVASPPWTEAFNRGAAASTIGVGGGSGKYLVTATTPGFDQTGTTWRGVPTIIPEADTATTLYLRFRAEIATQNSSFGLSVVGTPLGWQLGSFGEFGNQMRVSVQGGVLGFDGDNGNGTGGGTWTPTAQRVPINVGQWYNLWAVINNSTNKFDVYLKAVNEDATLADRVLTNYGFRRNTVPATGGSPAVPYPDAGNNNLVTFMAMTQGSAAGTTTLPLDLDDIYLTPGTVLSIPEPATMALLGLGSLALLRRRKS
jgi:hypothetical protein